MAVLSLVFSDGTSAKLPPITDSGAFVSRQYQLSDIAQGKTIVSLNVENNNTHRDVSISNIEVFDPTAVNGGLKPVNPVATARDAIITMEGIEMTRPSNTITDIVPGLTLNVKGVSDRPVELEIGTDIEAINDSIISFVGNYNRLMAEINVLTTPNPAPSQYSQSSSYSKQVIEELTYLTAEEKAAYYERLGAFAGDSTLSQVRNSLRRTVSSSYPTSLERDLALLSQIGISTNAGSRGGGYDSSQMRGYLSIDSKVLDAALENKLDAVRQLFANDTTGDMINDTGVAVNIDAIV
jgi:flagellar hook-associated protein 2